LRASSTFVVYQCRTTHSSIATHSLQGTVSLRDSRWMPRRKNRASRPTDEDALRLTMLNFNHVYYFHVAATEGSLGRAAERVGVTQSTISEQIKHLERALDVDLFERTGSGLRLTESGRAVFVHTTTMFRAAERIMETVGKGLEHTPILRVGISTAVSRSIATDFLLPVVRLDGCLPTVQNGEFPVLLQALRRTELDLLLAETVPPTSALDGLHVADLHRPRLNAIAHPSTRPADDWADQAVIQYSVMSAYRWEVETFLASRGLRPRVVAETDDALLMLEAAARSDCIAFVPRSVSRDAVVAGRVVVVATLDPGTAGVHAIYHDVATADLARRAVALLVEHAMSLDT
jgi:LysR family transcriptional activator of nhaA